MQGRGVGMNLEGACESQVCESLNAGERFWAVKGLFLKEDGFWGAGSTRGSRHVLAGLRSPAASDRPAAARDRLQDLS